MKVLLLATHLNTGGIGVYTVNLARYLSRKGVEVSVVSGGGDLQGRLDAEAIPHVEFDIKTKSEFGIKVWKNVNRLAKMIKEEGYDLVHAQTRVTQVLGYLSSAKAGVPLISTCHGFFKHRRLLRRLFPCWGDRVIAISKSVWEHMVNDFHVPYEKVIVVYNGIELDKYSSASPERGLELRKKLGINASDMLLGAVGRLSPVKGYGYLIRAFKDISDTEDKARLIFVGEGPEKKALVNQARSLGIDNKIIFTPGGGPLEDYMAMFDIFCMPSVNEGLGLALMEAMAAGKPCIASDTGGLSELIEDGSNGLLVAPEDPVALGAAITRLIGDRSLRKSLGSKAAKKAMAEFSMERSVNATIEAYEGLLKLGGVS